MNDWFSLVAPFSIGLGILLVLGLPISLALRLRGFAIFLAGIPAAIASIALSSILSGFLGITWSIAAPITISLFLAAILWVLRRRFALTPTATRRTNSWVLPLGAAAIGGAAIGFALISGLKRADAISQTYDAIFHLNAVQFILDTGKSSPFLIDLTSPGTPSFYPTVWHSLTALIVQLTGTSIPVATNATLFIISTVIWPIGIVAFGRAIAGATATTSMLSGTLAAAFPNFPLALAGYGVLYPNLLSIALLPYVFVAVLKLLALCHSRSTDRLSPGATWLVAGGALGAAVLSHPSAFHVFLVWIIFPALAAGIRAFRRAPVTAHSGELAGASVRSGTRQTLAVIGLVSLAAAIVAAWVLGRTSDNSWGGIHGPRSALLDAAGLTPHISGHAWMLSVLLSCGALLLVARKKNRWLLGTAGIFLGLYIIADGFPPADWRTLFLSPWYNDPWRLATLVPLATFPLILVGANWFAHVLLRGVRVLADQQLGRSSRLLRAVPALGVALLLGGVQGPLLEFANGYLATKYRFDRESVLLDPAEVTLLERLDTSVPEGSKILNNPWNGSALAYAISDREVLVPHTGGSYDPQIYELASEIQAGTPEACQAAAALRAEYVLDFGKRYVFAETERALPFENISGISESPILREVDREDDAVLYAIDCD